MNRSLKQIMKELMEEEGLSFKELLNFYKTHIELNDFRLNNSTTIGLNQSSFKLNRFNDRLNNYKDEDSIS